LINSEPMKNLKITFLLITFALLQSCQQSESIQRPVLNEIQLEALLKTNLTYKSLVAKLDVATTVFLRDLTSNSSKLTKDELEKMNQIWIKYSSAEDFVKFTTEDKKDAFQKLTPNIYDIDERIAKLSDEIGLRYSFDHTDLLNLLSEKAENLALPTKSNRSFAGGCDGYCEHKALSAYYRFLSIDSSTKSGASVYASGYYAGCFSNCN
jgi:hypothetical protein